MRYWPLKCLEEMSRSRAGDDHLRHPRSLFIRAWLWLAAETDDPDEKRQCLEAAGVQSGYKEMELEQVL